MSKYIQQLLPRIRAFSSDLDRKELFVNKLFTLLQPNNEVHQYTFNRDGRLILSIDGITTLGTWELLATGQLLINRGKDIITLDFDFLHPDVLIMKMGGTADNPFIIYDKKIITDGNVLNFLKIFDAEKRNQRIFRLPKTIILESEVDKKIFDENGKPYNGVITSAPYHYHKYNYMVEDIKIVKSGIVIESYFDVKYLHSVNFDKDNLVVIRQKEIKAINVGDKIILDKSFERLKSVKKASMFIENRNLFFDEDYVITNIKSNSDWIVYFIVMVAVVFLIHIFINYIH
jgi:hypothetical protein